ncbi:RHS repeat domain-containing protein [Pseudomonas japonica]|uniref:Insecticidal toxin complex protein TccC n=1 Tax=Pseudomonas japonica TaxID=256466 RepID=A0A239LY89_9PSED|nr:RHS repeat-associated core domain-containing protein [Pseudomonas japonica]SNT34763.1 insecticidal toxin complex protein TccC [Pseudomonas japonica]
MSAPSAVHRHTPVLRSQDARGLPARRVDYHRAATEPAVRRVSLSRHDAAGQMLQQWDPRQFERLDQGEQPGPCQRTLRSLSGRTLLDQSSDGGWQLLLAADAGPVSEQWDSRTSHWHTEYDELLRPVLIRESASGQSPRSAERFAYARERRTANCRGRLVRHDDDGGSRLVTGYGLGGQVRRETRHFLTALDLPDWPATPADRDELLEPGDGATTVVIHGPLRQVLEQTDALGNRQSLRFTPNGELAGLRLFLNDGTQHSLLGDVRYDAFGQIEAQTAGNGVVSLSLHDPATGRLSQLSAHRPGRAPLQDLTYQHDPVGNLIHIEDRSQPTAHFANQRVEPVNTYAYDSLYQLIASTGREAAGAVIGPALPELAPNPGDTSRLLNYSQHYDYDASGNLLHLSHVGQHPYSHHFNVAEQSNHAVPEPGDPLAAFDANGNLRDLAPGQPLHWNARNQLHGTRQVSRDDGPDDDEHYRYGGDGLRLRKVASRLVSGRVQRSETRYLPGLERHTRPGEAFAVITAQAGRCSLRCLVWSEGSPDGSDNPQLRYSLRDPHDSSALELDDDARIISHEGWYPFGGTAWWAGRSAIEAGYKARRHSGKERDATGLYAYGLRYYAPWLARWISPDPAGDIDGLNRYRFVHNNPPTLVDHQGLNADERRYEIQPFSKMPRARAPAPASDNRLGTFVYDTLWSVKSYLNKGAGNQYGDIKGSDYRSMIFNAMARQNQETPLNDRNLVEHAMAAEAGLCDDFTLTGLFLMGTSPERPGNVPLFSASRGEHRFGLVGDPRQSDPLLFESWVTLPTVLPWSQSLLAEGADLPVDYTPRMPGEPGYAIGRQRVRALRQELYAQSPDIAQAYLQSSLDAAVLGGQVWSQVSAMKMSQGAGDHLDSVDHAAASVPMTHWPSTRRALEHALTIRDDSLRAPRLLRF